MRKFKYKVQRFAALNQDEFVIGVYELFTVVSYSGFFWFLGIGERHESVTETFRGYHKIGSDYFQFLKDATKFESVEAADGYLKRMGENLKVEKEIEI